MSYDNQYRISSISVGQGFSLAYSQEHSGNIKSIKNLLDATKNKVYTYIKGTLFLCLLFS